MGRFNFCACFVFLNEQLISFARRPYLRAIYDSPARRMVLRFSRQVEKTTFICNAAIHAAVTIPGVHIVIVFPRREQALVFARSRLLPVIMNSPVLKRILIGQMSPKLDVSHMRFKNGSEIFIRAAFHSADAVRGIDADYLLVDEYQDIAGGDLPVLEQSLSHSAHRKVILTGTPKTIDNHIERAFNLSTANEWRVPCSCGQQVLLDEKCLGIHGPICPACGATINPEQGLWIPRNPQSMWGDGYTLNHLATPWLDYRALLENQQTYSSELFLNECLGLPTFLGDHIVTRAQVEACCEPWPMAQSLSDGPPIENQLLAGIDWGGGSVSHTVLVIGFMRDDDHFVVVFMERYRAREEPDEICKAIAQRCEQFKVQVVAADGAGNGNVFNNLLLNSLPQLGGLYAMFYSGADQQPKQYKGRLWKWTIGRTPSLGMVFTRVKKRRILFPRIEDSSSFIDEIWCEVAQYDQHQRTIKYTHPETQPDDTLHAINYVSTVARRAFDVQQTYG